MPRVGNEQSGFTRLVDMRSQGLSNKDYLNVLRDKDPRRRDRLSTKSGNKRARILQQETKV